MNLRTELKFLAEDAASYADADAALGLAGRQRRRRALVVAVAAVLALSLVPLTAWGLGGNRVGPPAHEPVIDASRVGLAMQLEPDVVRFDDGSTVTLPQEVDIPLYSLALTPNGLLVSGDEAMSLLSAQGQNIDRTPARAQSWAVSPDGARLAWSDGQNLSVAQITAEGFQTGNTATPSDQFVVGGWADGLVVLTGDPDFDGLDDWMTWDPSSNELSDWYDAPVRVYGMSAGGDLVARSAVTDAQPCLLLLDPRTGQTKDERCEPELFPGSTQGEGGAYRLSADGTLLFQAKHGLLIDVEATFARDAMPVSACVAGDDAEWGDGTTIVVRDGQRLTRCDFATGGVPTELDTDQVGHLIRQYGM